MNIAAAIPVAALLTGVVIAPQPRTLPSAAPQPEEVCHDDMSAAVSRLDDAMLRHDEVGNPTRAKTVVLDAARLFRFNRRQDALRNLDAAVELLNGAWGRTIDAGRRNAAVAAIRQARRCVETHRPPPLATLTVRTFLFDDDAAGHAGAPAAGAPVEVDHIRMGQTGSDGALTVLVPAGELQVNALWPAAGGEAFVSLAPGETSNVSVVIDPGSRSVERTDLVLVEAVNDVLPKTATSFTVKFVRDGDVLRVLQIHGVELVDSNENPLAFIHDLFTVTDGTIAARDPAAVYALLGKYAGQRLGLQVEAVDGGHFSHGNIVWFRVATAQEGGR